MSSTKRITAVALSVLLVLSVVGPALAVAQTGEQTETSDDGSLSYDVENGANDTIVITVYDENGTVEGATVTVDTAEDANETETEDANETETEDANETETEDANETDTNSTYAGTGTYTTDENGTVTLPAPDGGVRLQITVEHDGESTTSEVTVNEGVGVPFGQRVSSFVQQLLSSDSNESIGQAVSDFVRGNNPGNAPEHAGPPEDRGPNDDRSERGPPEDAGPPEDRGPNDDTENGGQSEDAGNGGGPPGDDEEATPTPTSTASA